MEYHECSDNKMGFKRINALEGINMAFLDNKTSTFYEHLLNHYEERFIRFITNNVINYDVFRSLKRDNPELIKWGLCEYK